MEDRGRNYPKGLGKRNLPLERSWGTRKGIANLPSVIGLITDRSVLPQLRGVVFPGGSIDGPIVGQIAGKIRERIKVFRQTEKNIPLAWGPRTWPKESIIGTLASVIQTGVIYGPTRTMHPLREMSIVEDIYLEKTRGESSRNLAVQI